MKAEALQHLDGLRNLIKDSKDGCLKIDLRDVDNLELWMQDYAKQYHQEMNAELEVTNAIIRENEKKREAIEFCAWYDNEYFNHLDYRSQEYQYQKFKDDES